MTRMQTTLFTLGDYIAAAIVGGATAAAVRAVVSPGLDMAVAMVIGMAVGMIVHLALAVLLTPLLGAFHVMVPTSLIGMYGGMLFAMRDSMQHPAGTASHGILVGFAFGAMVMAGVHLYDRALRGRPSFARSV